MSGEALYSTGSAFAALKTDGSVVAWGYSSYGGNAPNGLTNVTTIYSTGSAFAALKTDGSVVAWPSSRGVNNHDNNQIVFSGWLVGIGANNASNLGGWSFTGGASAEVCDGIGNPFPNPIILGDVSSSFNQENLAFAQTAWVRANNPSLGGLDLTIRLNIPVGETINVNDPQNLDVNLNKIIIQQIPIT
eukprot:GSChrysophyteH2.ASY1.ANO1.1515.1 assembled CDS